MALKPRFFVLLLVVASLLTVLTATVSLAQGPGSKNAQVPPDQQDLINAKEKARQEAGAPAEPPADGEVARSNQPVRQFTGQVQMTKAELLALVDAGEAAEQAYLAWLEREGHADVAQKRRNEYEAERRRIKALPNDPVQLEIPGVEVGHGSINFSKTTYKNSDLNDPKDPINVIFYGAGSAWSVHYDLINWTSTLWQDTSCSGTQQVFIYDSSHTGGWDGWRQNEFPMTPGTTCWPGARDHLRLFQRLVLDSHSPGYDSWSVTSAHHDNNSHSCSDDWEGPETRLTNAFRDANGNPLWFVGAIWESDIGNAGTHGSCGGSAVNNGRAQFIGLNF